MEAPTRPPLSAEHLSAIVENSSDAIISIDLDGRIESWNAAAQRIYGWSANEMIGRNVWPLIPEDRQDEEAAILERVRKGDLVSRFETIRMGKGGVEIPVAVTVSPIRNAAGEVIGASKIANDLREQYDLRQELQQSQQYFAALAQNIPQLAWMADDKGWIFWYNQRWYDYTGTTLEQMQGWGWRDVHHPDHLDRVVESIQHSWDTGEPWEDTFPLRGTDGNYRWFLSRAQPMRDKDGNVVLWCGTNTDVTEQREANDRIRMLMREVNHRARNMLSTIQAIVHRSAKSANPELEASIINRIGALSANLDVLSESSWSGADVTAIVHSQIEHLAEKKEQVTIKGMNGIIFKPSVAEALGLAIHELATNAEKHGSLSTDKGSVIVDWRVEKKADGEETFVLEWTESGGPPVEPTGHEGFGSIILSRYPRMVMQGEAMIHFAADGLHYTLHAPLTRMLANGLDVAGNPVTT